MPDVMVRNLSRIWALLLAILAVSGFAQMPIFKRYYIADVPGLAWTADYYFTHKMHYLAAAALLGLAAWIATRWMLETARDWKITGSAWLRIGLLLGIVVTGGMRMYKNQPGMSFSPELTMVVDWTHLGIVLLLGLAALVARILGKGRYVVRRDRVARR